MIRTMYPAMLNIKNKRVTVVGGGRVAYRKVKTFLKFEARVRVVSPVFVEEFGDIGECIERIVDNFEVRYLDKSFIVVAATNDSEVNNKIGKYCEKHGILCNIIDQPELSSYIVPAHMNQGDLTISVSTNGKSPVLAKLIKEELEEKYDKSYKERIEILGRLREIIIKDEKDVEQRHNLLRYIAKLELKELRNYEASYFTC